MAEVRQLLQLGERQAADVLHDDEQLVVVLDHVQGLNDVRVGDPRREPRLVDEQRLEVVLPGKVRMHALDGDRPGESSATALPGQIHRGHAAGGESLQQPVAPRQNDGLRFFRATHG